MLFRLIRFNNWEDMVHVLRVVQFAHQLVITGTTWHVEGLYSLRNSLFNLTSTSMALSLHNLHYFFNTSVWHCTIFRATTPHRPLSLHKVCNNWIINAHLSREFLTLLILFCLRVARPSLRMLVINNYIQRYGRSGLVNETRYSHAYVHKWLLIILWILTTKSTYKVDVSLTFIVEYRRRYPLQVSNYTTVRAGS